MPKGNRKTKIIKVFSIVLILIFSVVSVRSLAHIMTVQSHKEEAANYLVEKYNFDKRKLILLNYKSARYHRGEFLVHKGFWSPEEWRFKYNGRKFELVLLDDNRYIDNYQLDEIFEWSLKYLQGVDENVIGIRIEDGFSDKLLTANDMEDYLKQQESFFIYYRVDNLEEYYDSNGRKQEYYKKSENMLLSKFAHITTVPSDRGLKKETGVSFVPNNMDIKFQKIESDDKLLEYGKIHSYYSYGTKTDINKAIKKELRKEKRGK